MKGNRVILNTAILLISSMSLLKLSAQNENSCVPTNLRCEHLAHPLGIDRQSPRFSWYLSDTRNGAKQTAYQIAVGKDSLALSKGKGAIWKKQISGDQMLTTYTGKALEPCTRYYWSISVWDKDKKKSQPVVSSFETGLLTQRNWQGKFISDGKDMESRDTPYFRKQISLNKEVESARAYIVAAGLYELSINGEKVGDHYLDPAFTDYGKRLLYVTHDVTSLLQQGKNAIGVILGNGWYNHQPVAEWNFHNAPWRDRPSFCMDIRIRYTDGTEEIIASDNSFKTNSGPITFNAIYLAENHDFRKDMPNWNKPSFDDSSWQTATEVEKPDVIISSQTMHPIRITDFRKPIEVKKLSDTLYLYNFGQNWSGITTFTAQGEAGTKVKLRHGEQLDSRGKRLFDDNNTQFYQNVNEPLKYGKHPEDELFQTDVLILDGKRTRSLHISTIKDSNMWKYLPISPWNRTNKI